jgi:sulfate transport system ATP-binding protein
LRIELLHQLNNDVLHVELPRAQERSLNLTVGAELYARPTASKVFLE